MTPEQKLWIIRLAGVAALIIVYSMIKCMQIYAARFDKMPLHTPSLTGDQWVQELIDGHKEHFYNEMGMRDTVFHQLLELLMREGGLRNTRYVTA
jgi:hypothetical protein